MIVLGSKPSAAFSARQNVGSSPAVATVPRKPVPPSARSLRDQLLIGELSRIHKENYSVYGIRKMWHAMARAGWNIGRDQVPRLMRAAGLQGVRRGRKVVTITPAAVPDHRPDLVQRNFRAAAPHRV